jgi:D-beta-D-heptose 7-phosphate kinase/D-beta-D-heptose 1-phosphate adenosyltransferase|tara:strand:- start:504 stop:926 length:423 start_codon:yes stop_codon:yes gene_type:complete
MRPKKNVWVNGTFDVLHMGHIKLLERASFEAAGGLVAVGIDTDRRVKELKGDSRPVNNEMNRSSFLGAIKYVDCVYLFDTDKDLKTCIKSFKPDLMVIGEDYRDKPIIGSEYIDEIIYVERYEGLSSSDIINGTYKTPYL